MFVDAARNEKGSDAGILIRGPDGVTMKYALRFTFRTTNNEAEYEALIARLAIVKSLGISRIWVQVDSKLVIDQDSQLPIMIELPNEVYVEIREKPAHEENSCLPVLQEPEDWRTHIARYLVKGQLPEDVTEAQKIKYRSFRFHTYSGDLYKKSWDGSLLSCVSKEDILKILDEVHQGWCGSHIEGRSLAVKDYPNRILLAHVGQRCCELCEEVRRVPENGVDTIPTHNPSDPNTKSCTVRHVEN
ncbi:hypothetical protein LIER_39163 [Lithospermum erythrorhizon]|uniref:RNase H type-1 domain-containing protein n=1 Tax=Lithospermum erythrorhizon TaxID=34254 RepID=A0AAV3QBU6_LITER